MAHLLMTNTIYNTKYDRHSKLKFVTIFMPVVIMCPEPVHVISLIDTMVTYIYEFQSG